MACCLCRRTRRNRYGLDVVNLGDDADTTGVVLGQLAGGYGLDAIPVEWRTKLAVFDKIEALATGLHAAAAGIF